MPAYPEAFWLFIILGPVLIIIVRRFFTGRRNLRSIAGSWRPQQFYDLYTVKSFFISLGMLIFIAASILSLVGFPGRQLPRSYEPSGTDIVFVVDVSESMKAGDVSPSRLTAATRIIRSICENTPGGRFGLVVFKGEGIKIIPSTEDVESIYNFLENISTDLLTSPGSNIQGGISTALSAFTESEEKNKYIILLTDGEILEGSMVDTAEKAAAADTVIYTVGIGTVEGAQIPQADGGFLADSSGQTVITKLHPEGLRYLAEVTSGRYYDSDDAALIPDLIDIARGTAALDESRYKIVVKDNYRIFLVIALLGLLLTRAVKVVKWKNMY